MTDWKKELCGTEYPKTLELASRDTYIQRRNIEFVEGIAMDDGMTDIGDHYECESRFITKDEHAMLKSIEEISNEKAIDDYTLRLMEEGVL